MNVARGAHIVTDDLVAVLAEGRIGGAALDVTDPEPLPDGHPLWDEPRCIITPHTANTFEMAIPLLSERVRENVRRRLAGEPLLGLVDPAAGLLTDVAEPVRRSVGRMDFRTTTVAALAADVRAKRTSARELVGAALDRIEEIDPRINAFVALDGEQALADAAAARRAGRRRARTSGRSPASRSA